MAGGRAIMRGLGEMTMRSIGDVEAMMLEKTPLCSSSRLDKRFMRLGH